LSDDTTATLGSDGPSDGDRASGLTLRVVGEGISESHPLPVTGRLVIGRSEGADIRINDASVSRKHAVLHVVEGELRIEDLGSANGTKVGGRKLANGEAVGFAPGESIDLGSVLIVVRRGSVAGRPRRLWSHGHFEAVLENACDRAARGGGAFAVARLSVAVAVPPERVLAVLSGCLRAADVTGSYGPGEYELLLGDLGPADARSLLRNIASRFVSEGVHADVACACYPRDGRTAESLIVAACRGLRYGEEDSADEPPTGEVLIEDAGMKRLVESVDRVAAGTLSVLLLGETGVGKDVMAQEIHRRSPRARGPLIKINCAALPDTLMESELFGHEKGAFTGALSPKLGLLEAADGGTVFLDEIGDLPLPMQAKLLRVLEDRELLRVGSTKPRPIDVRFVSATNRDLDADIARGAFRRDLYYRLSGFSLLIPPLRQRRSEILPLVRTFLRQACRQAHRRDEPQISPQALELLQRYTWPGNLRELRNVVERALLLCAGDVITPEHLPEDKITALVSTPSSPARSTRLQEFARDQTTQTMRETLDPIERDVIEQTLEKCGGNQSEAARMLGISRGALLARLKKYGLSRPRSDQD
jgi:DNA-binding NtrC family response regulator